METTDDTRTHIHDAERILAKIKHTPHCWEWTGSTNKDGYGIFFLGAAKVLAHRWVYELLAGPIPKCRNRGCVRPSHLEPVTDRENILRGIGPSAVNAAKVRCPKGHEYAVRTTATESRSWRFCRACHRERSRVAMAESRKGNRPGRQPCSVCGVPFAVKADGTVYRHFGLDSAGLATGAQCAGAGRPPSPSGQAS